MKPVDVFHIGPPKTATTWLYRCLKEHPEISTSPFDSVHYFDILFERGPAWYASHFKHTEARQKKFDPTPSYICSPKAPIRIYRHNPDACIIFTLRNPIDRAFSHFWHLKKQGATTLTFEKILSGYDYFSTWLEQGFLSDPIEQYLNLFSRKQLHWIIYEDLQEAPHKVFQSICQFIGIKDNFIPADLNRIINVAGQSSTLKGRIVQGFGRRFLQSTNHHLSQIGTQLLEVDKLPGSVARGTFSYWRSEKKEYLHGIDPELRSELQRTCEPEICRMEELLGIDLATWRKIN